MTKKTINNFANEDALEGLNLQRLQMKGPEGTRGLSALLVKNRHRIPDTTANYSNIQHPKFQTSCPFAGSGNLLGRF